MNSYDNSDGEIFAKDLIVFLDKATKQTWPAKNNEARAKSYRIALGWEPIQLGIVEFHILLFLASRPYHAFTLNSIAEAVSNLLDPTEDSNIEIYIKSLRDQLGVFHDYVQTVPGVGFRFKQ